MGKGDEVEDYGALIYRESHLRQRCYSCDKEGFVIRRLMLPQLDIQLEQPRSRCCSQ